LTQKEPPGKKRTLYGLGTVEEKGKKGGRQARIGVLSHNGLMILQEGEARRTFIGEGKEAPTKKDSVRKKGACFDAGSGKVISYPAFLE